MSTSPRCQRLRVLVAIANHGNKNHRFLTVLLDEYLSMDLDVHLVVLSDAPKSLGSNVEVRVGAPTDDPRSLPFAHRSLFAERASDFDLFVYSEDDTLITQRHLEAFLQASSMLNDDEVAGFLRYEVRPSGGRSYSSIHSNYRWLPESIVHRGEDVFARFSNAHSACYVLTQRQLLRAIDSGGFLVAPHKGEYDMLVSAASDPYTQCGLTRLLCVSRVDEFLLHHLPNVYLDRMGVSESEFRAQIRALLEIASGIRTDRTLLDPASALPTPAWDVPSHPTDAASLGLAVTERYERALTVGCSSGDVERRVLGPDCEITAIPIDEVLGAVARTRGIATTSPVLETGLEELAGERFPLIILHQVLHHVEEPTRLLRSLTPLLAPKGRIVVTVPNVEFYRTKQRLGRAIPPLPERGYPLDRVHGTDARQMEEWLRDTGLKRPSIRCHTEGRAAPLARLSPRRLGRTIVATCQKPRGVDAPTPNGACLADGRLPSLISVVIPAYNEASFLGQQLEALAQQTYDGAWEVLVADNGSSDGTAAVAAAFAERLPSLRIVDASARRGASHARNVGSEAAHGDAIAYVDADDVATPGWLAAIATALRTHDFVAGRSDEPVPGEPGNTSPPGSHWKGLPRGDLNFLPWAFGGNCAVRTKAYKEIGGWREDLAHFGEDVDFCWRLQLAGFPLTYVPDAVMCYRQPTAAAGLIKQRFNFGSRAPRLYLEFRAYGAERPSAGTVAHRWLWLVTRSPYLCLSRPLRQRWLGVAAGTAGRVWGSLKWRVLCV